MTTPTETAIAALKDIQTNSQGISLDEAETAFSVIHELAQEALTALRAPVAMPEGYEKAVEDALDVISATRQEMGEDQTPHTALTLAQMGIAQLRKGSLLRKAMADMPPPAAGGMKDVDYWLMYFVRNAPQPENSQEREDFLVDYIKRIQADALATQPEARPDNGKETPTS